jgi:hypothetical protein
VSNSEIKAWIDQMSNEERFLATVYLKHCNQQRDPAYQSMLAGRMQRMDSGQKVTLEQAQRIHSLLETKL